MTYLWDLLFDFYPLVAAVCSMLLAQLFKLVYLYLKEGELNLRSFVTSGGMPSSHSAMVAGLTTAVGLRDGMTSTLFCISMVFSLIVLYDASGVRRAVGEQTELINQLVDDFLEKGEVKYEKLREFLGHTPLEVMIGMLLGIGVAFSLFY